MTFFSKMVRIKSSHSLCIGTWTEVIKVTNFTGCRKRGFFSDVKLTYLVTYWINVAFKNVHLCHIYFICILSSLAYYSNRYIDVLMTMLNCYSYNNSHSTVNHPWITTLFFYAFASKYLSKLHLCAVEIHSVGKIMLLFKCQRRPLTDCVPVPRDP